MKALPYRLLSGLLLAGLSAGGCIETYEPQDTPPANVSYLVVDGAINPVGRTVIKLLRTTALTSKSAPPVETRATVTLLDDQGRTYPLPENPAGTYTSASQTLDPGRQYRVRITTGRGKVYESEPTAVKLTPPIDRLSWKLENDELRISLDAHDATGNSRYYRWEYTETWEFVAAYYAQLEFRNTTLLPPGQYVFPLRINDFYQCWRTENSTTIQQASTARLSQDVVSQYPVRSFAVPGQRLYNKYSILVRQYAQTAAEYDYWDLLRKNTEALGTLNDPLPTQVTGNVHAVADPDEFVLGFVGAHTVTEKRIFIDRSEFPRTPQVYADPENAACELIDIPKDMYNLDGSVVYDYALSRFQGGLRPVFERGPNTYASTTVGCVDCRLRGTNVKPSFWP